MPNYFIIFFYLLIFLFCMENAISSSISVLDDTQNQITLKSPANRIISLSPGLAELTYAAGGGGYLKGVVNYSNFPKSANQIPQIGSYNSLDLEKILALKPDLILAWETGNPPLQISKLKKLGIPVFMSETRTFADIPSTILRLGKLMGTSNIAKQAANNFNTQLAALKKRYPESNNKKTVFIQIWNQPLMSINGKHLISKIISQCNGKNIFHDARQLTITLNIETILEKNPDVIIVTRNNELGNSWLSPWKRWEFMAAVQNDALYRVNPDFVVRHTPRILKGIQQVCEYIHEGKS